MVALSYPLPPNSSPLPVSPCLMLAALAARLPACSARSTAVLFLGLLTLSGPFHVVSGILESLHQFSIFRSISASIYLFLQFMW